MSQKALSDHKNRRKPPADNGRPKATGSLQPKGTNPPKVNRLPEYFSRLEEYWFHGPQRRFARDAGITESTFSRVLRGATTPSYRAICQITALIEEKLGEKIDPRDIFEP